MFFLGIFFSLSSLHLDQTIDVRSLEHKREVKKKTRSGDRKMRKMLKTASKVRPFPLAYDLSNA